MATRDKTPDILPKLPADNPSSGKSDYFVPFRLDDQRYALPLEQVDRVIRMTALTSVPGAPVWIAGLLNLHSKVVPVLNLRVRFNLTDKEIDPDDHLILIRAHEKTLAVMADVVEGVQAVRQSQVVPPPHSMDEKQVVRGVVQSSGALILVLESTELEPINRGIPSLEHGESSSA